MIEEQGQECSCDTSSNNQEHNGRCHHRPPTQARDCDFQHDSGVRLEVKQSASRQSWDTTRTIDRKIGFDIAERTGHFDGTGWVPFEQRRRMADVYVFAHHPVVDESADHRDPSQWQFYVVLTSQLPPLKRLSLARTRQLAELVLIEDLAQAVVEVAPRG